jgi:hypothetical protein
MDSGLSFAHSLRMTASEIGVFLRTLNLVAALLLLSCTAHASGFLDADQDAMRADLEYLANERVLSLPVSTWPLPIDEVHSAVAAVDPESLSAAPQAAVARLRRLLDIYDTSEDDEVRAAISVHPTRFRQNEPLPREDATIGINAGRDYGRFTAHLSLSFNSRPPSADIPIDRQMTRADGSYVSMTTGNWIWSAGALSRSWGPSQNDSLILSTNARPMMAVGLDRVSALPPQWHFMRWLGPWRFSIFLGRMDGDRTDIKSPLFGGARFTFKPTSKLEVGLSRTSQFCGRGRPCNFTTFKNLLLGNTNTNTSANVTRANDPGNDMAGFDVRWTSPIGHLPYAIYAQMIGEDQQGGVPFKYLGEAGLDVWRNFTSGSLLHLNIEYANTACSFTRTKPIYGCAYQHYLFNLDGYRYRDRVVGSTWEGDAEIVSAHLRWTRPSGDEWRLHTRHGTLNRGGVFYVFNVDAPSKRDLNGMDLEYRFNRGQWGSFRTGVGVDSLHDPATGKTTKIGRWFLMWNHKI